MAGLWRRNVSAFKLEATVDPSRVNMDNPELSVDSCGEPTCTLIRVSGWGEDLVRHVRANELPKLIKALQQRQREIG